MSQLDLFPVESDFRPRSKSSANRRSLSLKSRFCDKRGHRTPCDGSGGKNRPSNGSWCHASRSRTKGWWNKRAWSSQDTSVHRWSDWHWILSRTRRGFGLSWISRFLDRWSHRTNWFSTDGSTFAHCSLIISLCDDVRDCIFYFVKHLDSDLIRRLLRLL